MIRINLLPHREEKRKAKRQQAAGAKTFANPRNAAAGSVRHC